MKFIKNFKFNVKLSFTMTSCLLLPNNYKFMICQFVFNKNLSVSLQELLQLLLTNLLLMFHIVKAK